MKHFESSWKAKDGLETYFQGWEPEKTPQAAICLVHGLGEHSGRYVHVADHLTAAGFAVLTMDLRGHGKSAGARGHVASSEIFLDDIDRLLKEADDRYPGKPRFLYGHSLGGILVLFYTLKRKPELAGVVATSSGLRTALEKQTAKVAFSKFLAALLPELSMPSGLNAADISRDPEVVRIYQNDPLVHDRASLAFAKAMFDALPWTFQHAPEFKPPLLLVHGTEDKIAYASGSQEFASLVPGDCTLKLWDGLYHETHNEPEKEQVLAFLTDWLQSKLQLYQAGN
jgi:alpha-beta hydrolase superfamily lysophospholipase